MKGRLAAEVQQYGLDIAWKAEVRLCGRYGKLIARGKRSQIAATDIVLNRLPSKYLHEALGLYEAAIPARSQFPRSDPGIKPKFRVGASSPEI